VRQLENICHWLTVMAPAQVIEVKDLPPEVLAQPAGAVVAAVPFSALSSGAGGVMVEALGHADAALANEGDAMPLTANGQLNVQGTNTAAVAAPVSAWESGLEQEALALLNAGRTDVWDVLTRRFETSLIQSALATTRGRRIEAAQKLGIGRNTITRKIQELGLDES